MHSYNNHNNNVLVMHDIVAAVSRGAGGSAQSSAATLAVESPELAADGQVPAGAWHGGPRGSHGGQGGGWQHGPWHRR